MAAWFNDSSFTEEIFVHNIQRLSTTEEFNKNTGEEIKHKVCDKNFSDFRESDFTKLGAEYESAENLENKLNDDLKDDFSELTLWVYLSLFINLIKLTIASK